MPTPVLSPVESEKGSPKSPSTKESTAEQDTHSHLQPKQDLAAPTPFPQDISPLTTTLPADSQQLLGPILNPANPFDSMLMGGNLEHSGFMTHSFSGPSQKDSNFYPNLDGMNTTLAPSASQTSQPSLSVEPNQTFGTYDHFDFDNLKGNELGNVSDGGSVSGTPGIDGTWDAFIDENSSWAENAT